MTETARAGSEPSPQDAHEATSALSATYGATAAGGLSAPAAVLVVAVVTFVAGLLSALTHHGFGAAFNVVYLLVTVYAAVRIRVEDRFTAVVAPPLLYAATLLVAGRFDATATDHAFKVLVEDTFVALSLNAPWLVGTTLIAILIAVLRGRRAVVRRRA